MFCIWQHISSSGSFVYIVNIVIVILFLVYGGDEGSIKSQVDFCIYTCICVSIQIQDSRIHWLSLLWYLSCCPSIKQFKPHWVYLMQVILVHLFIWVYLMQVILVHMFIYSFKTYMSGSARASCSIKISNDTSLEFPSQVTVWLSCHHKWPSDYVLPSQVTVWLCSAITSDRLTMSCINETWTCVYYVISKLFYKVNLINVKVINQVCLNNMSCESCYIGLKSNYKIRILKFLMNLIYIFVLLWFILST